MSQNRQSRDEPVQAVEQFAVSLQAAIETLTHDLAVVTAIREGLRSTKPVATVVADARLAIERSRLTDAIIELERARGQARNWLFRALHSEGVSIGEISRLWGMSRQLASRILRDQADS